ncbi:hypothetical protein FVQ98_12520 [Ottowia sp. GY511]|uniref:Uncharacterized protein n=1 Tax=Ottowia flava TaxID=2675430 RepID=A0ABW4KTW9_9BURK|nr:hypothetical protein [Ottowia sp. GY511]TXK27086.1 hypothetical protein FVQ98_12520 [Ottowia sp. GY511]
MSDGVYLLTPQGRKAHAGETSGVPPQLRPLLALIDGRRTRGELLAICGRSAVSAGGLRWLTSAGFTQRVPRAAVACGALPDGVTGSLHSHPSPNEVAAPRRAPPASTLRGEAAPTVPPERSGPASDASLLPMQASLSAYLHDAIQRHLGDDGGAFLRRVQRAQSLSDLLACLHPLIDAVLQAAGPHAAADLADGAAGILQPRYR